MYNNNTRFQVKILHETSSEKLTEKLNVTVKEMFQENFRLNNELSDFKRVNEYLFMGFLVFECKHSKTLFCPMKCQIFENISETSFFNLEKAINISFENHAVDSYYPQKITLLNEFSVIISFQKSNMIQHI